jgi:hypothetical protein
MLHMCLLDAFSVPLSFGEEGAIPLPNLFPAFSGIHGLTIVFIYLQVHPYDFVLCLFDGAADEPRFADGFNARSNC